MISFRNKTIIVLFSTLFLSVVFTSPQIQGQTYEYLPTLMPGATYEWQVTTLATTGSVSTSFLDYGNETLKQGDIFSVKIIDDINNVTGGNPSELLNPANIWAEFYLNGNYKTNDTSEIGLIWLGWTGWVFYPSLLPVSYTNTTGNYSYLEVLHENFDNTKYENKAETSYYGFYEYLYWKGKQSSSISKDTWTIKMQHHSEYREEDFVDPENWQKEQTKIDRTIEMRFNIETGFLVYLYYYDNWHNILEREGSLDDDVENIELLIESTQLPTAAPFNYGGVLLGVFAISLALYYRKKRK